MSAETVWYLPDPSDAANQIKDYPVFGNNVKIEL